MATLEKLKEHVEKSKSALAEGVKKAEDAKNSEEVRKLRKKVKRLSRKIGKKVYFDKMAEAKKKPRKERKSEES